MDATNTRAVVVNHTADLMTEEVRGRIGFMVTAAQTQTVVEGTDNIVTRKNRIGERGPATAMMMTGAEIRSAVVILQIVIVLTMIHVNNPSSIIHIMQDLLRTFHFRGVIPKLGCKEGYREVHHLHHLVPPWAKVEWVV